MTTGKINKSPEDTQETRYGTNTKIDQVYIVIFNFCYMFYCFLMAFQAVHFYAYGNVSLT